jgi:lipoprotein-releasing system permease protein
LRVSLFIAKRYLFSTRKKNFINFISGLSVVVVAFITAALVIFLSIFNGLEDLLRSINNSFDPQIKIEATEGKSFHVTPDFIKSIEQVQGVEFVTEVIEDFAYARYRDANQIVVIKGVSDNFVAQNRIPEENIIDGEFKLRDNNINYAVVGEGIDRTLSIDNGDQMFPLQLYYIKNVKNTVDPSQMYTRRNIITAGVFSIVQQFDENYVLVPLNFAQDLLNYGDRRTSLEIKARVGADLSGVEDKLATLLGSHYRVLNQEEQHADLYRILKIEKLFTFLSFVLLLAIGSINIFFSLTMLALDKKKDISVLASMGADQLLIRNIFLLEGGLIAASGTIVGLILGGSICLLQQTFGLVSMGMENAVMQSYPVKMLPMDFFLTLLAVSLITFMVSIRPAVKASKLAMAQHL